MAVVAPKALGNRRTVAPKAAAKVTKERFAEIFDATPVLTAVDAQGPLSMWALSKELKSRLSSRGGRPSLDSAETKMKVSILDEDFPALKQISESLKVDRYSASPAQVATILLHMALSAFTAEDVKKVAREM
jgi:hypothetical protein